MRLPSSDIRRILVFALAAGLGLGALIYGFARLTSGAPPASLAQSLPGAVLVGLLIGLAMAAAAKLALRQAAYDLHSHAAALTEATLPAPVPVTGDEVVYMRETLSQALAFVPRTEDLPRLARELAAAPDAAAALRAAGPCIAEHLPVQGAILLVVDGERQALIAEATWGSGELARTAALDLEETAIGRALTDGRVATYSGVQVRDLLPLRRGPETATLFCLPQQLRGQPLATLCLVAEGTEVRLNEEQLAFAQGVADLLNLAVQNGVHRLLFARETARLLAFEQLGGLLTGAERLERALEQVLRVAAGVTDSEHGTLLLLEPDEARVRYRVTLKQGDVLPLSVTVGPILKHGLAGWALRERRADVIDDTERDARWLPLPGLGEMRSVLVVPLLYGERALGVLTLAAPVTRHYTRRSLTLITALAAYAVTLLARGQYEEMTAPGQASLARRAFDGRLAEGDLDEIRADPVAAARALSFQAREVAALYVGVSGLERAEGRTDGATLLAEVFTPLVTEIAAAVQRHHGYVARQDDEGLLALFGYPSAQGDTCQQALRAAEEVQAVARRLRGRWRSQVDAELTVSAGLASGAVAAGLVGEGRYQEIVAVGPAIREARRIQRLARADEVLVAEGLGRRLPEGGPFQLELLPPLHHGGAPHTIYRLTPGRG